MKQETLNMLHKKQIEILDVVDEFCKKNNLSYFFMGGTLLGAVRHQGFIPWDDDIDIGMPRKDYEFFCKNVSAFLGRQYFLQTSYTDSGYGRCFAKIRINNTLFLEESDCSVENKHHGIFLDIFPIDECKTKETQFVLFKRKLARFVDSYIICKRSDIKIVGARKLLNIFPVQFLLKLRDGLTKGRGEAYYVNFIGTIPKDKYEPTKRITFEGKQYCAPADCDFILKQQYGDYMTLPPIEKRVTHNPIRISFDLNGPDAEI